MNRIGWFFRALLLLLTTSCRVECHYQSTASVQDAPAYQFDARSR